MPQHIKKGANALVAEALDGLPAISVEEAMPLVDAGTHVFVDVREGSEQAKGVISGAVISSRGLLEFHIDPDSPAHKPELASDKTFIFYCACRWPIRPCRQGGCRDGHGTSGQSDRWLQRVEKGRRTSIGITARLPINRAQWQQHSRTSVSETPCFQGKAAYAGGFPCPADRPSVLTSPEF